MVRDIITWVVAVVRAWYGWVGASATVGLVSFGQGMGWWGTPSKGVYLAILITGLAISMFHAWRSEHSALCISQSEKSALQAAYFNECPRLGLEILGPKGPSAWRDALGREACWFWLQHLEGRTPRSLRFDSIPSKCGRFTLDFEAVPYLEPAPQRTALIYHIREVGRPALNAHDMDRIGNIEAKMLGKFLDDSPPELLELHYVLTARFKDKANEELTRDFNIVFDKRTFAFLPNTD